MLHGLIYGSDQSKEIFIAFSAGEIPYAISKSCQNSLKFLLRDNSVPRYVYSFKHLINVKKKTRKEKLYTHALMLNKIVYIICTLAV